MHRVAIFIIVIFALPAAVFAHSGATGVVKERMELMKSIAAQMKLIGQMIKGEKVFSAESVTAAANALVRHADKMPGTFPEGSLDHPSEALPAIWEDWEGFTQSAEELSVSAAALAEVARGATSAEEILSNFTTVGKTCAACHQDFRQPD